MNEVDKSITRDSSIDQLVSLQTLDKAPADLIIGLIESKQNILIAGAIGSGKTVLLRALTNEVQQMLTAEQFALVQDSEEIKCKHKNMINLHRGLDSSTHSLGEVISTALGMNIDLLIVGDLHGDGIKEVLNCKTPFMACILGTSVMHALHNLEQFSTMNGYVPLKSQIVEQVQIVVLVEKIAGRQVVTEVTQITGWDERHKIFESIVLWAKNKG